jgi:uncharacterized coiled-coil protein SlyX
MDFDEEQLARQEKTLAELREEFSRLNGLFDAQLKAVGLTVDELKKTDPDQAEPEVKKLLAQAQEQAQRAGQARAGQAQEQARQQAAARPAAVSSRRRNAIKF